MHGTKVEGLSMNRSAELQFGEAWCPRAVSHRTGVPHSDSAVHGRNARSQL